MLQDIPFDGRKFDREHATAEGDVWELPCGEAEFLARERSHTYLGQGFVKRAFMLLAGIIVNILTGFCSPYEHLFHRRCHGAGGYQCDWRVDEGSIAAAAESRAATRSAFGRRSIVL